MKHLEGRVARVRSLAYSPDGSTLVSGGQGGLVRLWDVAAGRARSKVRASDASTVRGVAFSPDGSTIAAAAGHAGVRLWKADDLARLGTLCYRHHGAVSVDFRRDGRALVSADWLHYGGVSVVWDLDAMADVAWFAAPMGAWCAGFSPDGRRVAVGTAYYWVSLWDPAKSPDAAANRPPFSGDSTTDPHPEGEADEAGPWRIPLEPGARCLRYSPDGRRLAAGSGWSIHAFDPADGRRVARFKGHREMVRMVDYSFDGAVLASGSQDGTVRLWDAESGAERARYDAGIGKVDAVAFFPDGTTIAAGGEGGIVIWDVGTA